MNNTSTPSNVSGSNFGSIRVKKLFSFNYSIAEGQEGDSELANKFFDTVSTFIRDNNMQDKFDSITIDFRSVR